jgi:hypothetical protein
MSLDVAKIESRVKQEQADFTAMEWGPNDDHADILALILALRRMHGALELAHSYLGYQTAAQVVDEIRKVLSSIKDGTP